MADVVNLRQARKRKARSEAEAQAAENRVRFGRGKAQKRQDTARRDKLKDELDGKKLR